MSYTGDVTVKELKAMASIDKVWDDKKFANLLSAEGTVGKCLFNDDDQVIGFVIYELNKKEIVLLRFKGDYDQLILDIASNEHYAVGLCVLENDLELCRYFAELGFTSELVKSDDTVEDFIYFRLEGARNVCKST